MKKVTFILFIFSIWYIELFSQTPEFNLKKYWYYRQRLRDNFVVVSAGNEPGTNIPASVRFGTTLTWDDGNGSLAYYIGLLATEYRLLKDHGQDYMQTRNELYYALLAFERMDYYAETYFSKNGQVGTPSLNGFFIRDDVDMEFLSRWSSHPVLKDMITLNSTLIGNTGKEMSKDNVWHYLPNLALVKVLVDDATLFPNILGVPMTMREMAQQCAYRIVKIMHGNLIECIDLGIGLVCNNREWVVKNPVTGEKVAGDGAAYVNESGIPGYGFEYGFAKAGEWVSELDLDYANSESFEGEFYNFAYGTIALKKDNYSFCSLYTVMGGHTDYLQAAAVSGTDRKYPHFFLIDEILHGKQINLLSEKYYDLLNLAYECGTFRYPWGPGVYEWSSNNRLVWPENLGKSEYGDYSSIDYMLLHNLFWLVFKDGIFKDDVYRVIYIDNTYTAGVHGSPAVVTGDVITANNQLASNRDVTYNANISVKLRPGFKVASGAKFLAEIATASVSAELGFQMLDISDVCQGTSLDPTIKSAKVLSEDISEINNTADISIYPNPFNDFININAKSGYMIKIELLDPTNLIISKEYPNGVQYVGLSTTELHSVFYIMRITDIEGKVYIQKIIKQ